jgi:D-glycero-D-manno-heptose 1,7-bisphosphate phosphatase
MAEKQKIAFVDRDGTLIEEKDFLTDERDIELIDCAPDAIKLLWNLGYLVAVVSNQSGVARGLMSEQRMLQINEAVFRKFDELGAKPDFFFYCPHHPEAEVEQYRVECDCRKPGSGMIRMLEQLISVDLDNSVSIGDKLSDVQLCRNLGGRGILVLTGYGESAMNSIKRGETTPDFVAENVLGAARWIEKN